MKIFISYASEDKDFVDRLATDLKHQGIDIWIDKWEIKVGDSLISKISSGLSSSDFFIPILSPHSISSAWVIREISYGIIRELETNSNKIYPVLLDNCEIPPFLKDKAFADFRNNYRSGFEVLMQSLSALSPQNIESLNVEDVSFLLSEDDKKLCMEAVLSNQTLSVVWVSKIVIQSKIIVDGLGSSAFLIKANYKVQLPGGISYLGKEFTAKVFEDVERHFSKPCSGSFDFENRSGTHMWSISLNIPVYFRVFAKDKMCLRIVFEKPAKELISTEETGRSRSCFTTVKSFDETVLHFINGENVLAEITKQDISEPFIAFIANN